jgi:phenylpropionate dioxygenase-like ring-hydroxylating dioxygenase large terminal subunit
MAEPFHMNAWYAAAWDVDIKPALFPQTICGEKVILYRKADGEVAALEDSCWHRRLVPLSRGRLDGDTVVCGYHGMKFNAQGRCVYTPFQQPIGSAAGIRAYPVATRHRLVWLWMGAPALADPLLLPDMHSNEDPAWSAIVPGPPGATDENPERVSNSINIGADAGGCSV